MTITLLLEQRKVTVDNSLLQNSEIVTSLLSDTQQDDVEFSIPSQYSSVIDIYLDFINKISYDSKGVVVYPDTLLAIRDVEILVNCFFMKSFFLDNSLFAYLMGQAYGIWDEFYLYIPSLPDEELVYLHTPHKFVPEKYIKREGFFKAWLSINANKIVVLNGKDTYHTGATYYFDKQVKQLKTYLAINGKKVSFSHEETWYANGQPKYRTNYKGGNLDGLQEGWYENGQLEYRINYKDGKQDGLQERWYENGQPKYRINYKDGRKDGLQEGWYENGQREYVKEYRMGKLISEQKF